MSHYSIGEQKYPNPRNAEILVFTPIMLTNFMLPVMSSQCVDFALRVGCKKNKRSLDIRNSVFGKIRFFPEYEKWHSGSEFEGPNSAVGSNIRQHSPTFNHVLSKRVLDSNRILIHLSINLSNEYIFEID